MFKSHTSRNLTIMLGQERIKEHLYFKPSVNKMYLLHGHARTSKELACM